MHPEQREVTLGLLIIVLSCAAILIVAFMR
jgi:hypothetical protein